MADIEKVTELLEQLKVALDHGPNALQNQTTRREALRLAHLLVSSLEDPGEKAFETTLLVRTHKFKVNGQNTDPKF